MRILSVSSSLPYPPNDGTRIRTWNLLTRTADLAEVTVLTWLHPGMDRALVGAIRDSVHDVILPEFAEERRSPSTRLSRRARAMLHGVPPYLLERMDRSEIPAVKKGYYDLAIAEDDSALFLMPEVDCPVVVHRHNIFSDTMSGLIASDAMGTARKLKWKSEMGMWEDYDRRLSSHADLSIVTTQQAKASLKRLVPDARVEVVTNGVEQFRPVQGLGSTPTAVFIGTLNYEPNADAVMRFVKGVWPKVRERVPGATFKVIGREPLRCIEAIRSEGVEIVGEVPDIVAACAGASIGVVPLNAGSGIKNKTLEIMSMGLPVVASPQGYEGIPASYSDGLVKSQNEQQMADALSVLLTDTSSCHRLGGRAREFAKQWSWEAPSAAYRQILEAAASQTRTSKAAELSVRSRIRVA